MGDLLVGHVILASEDGIDRFGYSLERTRA